MIPQLFKIGYIPINTFGLMIACAMFAAIILLAKSFKSNGIDPKFAERYVIWGGFSGLLGARIWYLAQNYEFVKADLWSAIFSGAGFTFFGGFLLSAAVLYVLTRVDRIPISGFMDSVGPALTLGYAIGRLGCQLSGDGDYGIETNSIFGMSYQTGYVPTAPGVLVYPTPFFESTICIGILWILICVERSPSWQAPYRRFGLYLLLISIERFLIEFIRIEPHYAFGLSAAQFVSVVLFALGVGMLVRRGAADTT